VGPFKWGVGKVVANSPVPPTVIPIYHMGMERVMPQDENNQLLSMVPRRGVSVTVKIGTPVAYEDVLAAYHSAAAKRAATRAANGGKSGAKPPQHRFFMLSCEQRHVVVTVGDCCDAG
jgi:hypothetical protein